MEIIFSHRWCLWMCANGHLQAFEGKGRAARQIKDRAGSSHLGLPRIVEALTVSFPAIVTRQRRALRGAGPVASVDCTNIKGNVTKHTLPSSVHHMRCGKLWVPGSYLEFLKGLFFRWHPRCYIFCLLVELFGVYFPHKKKWYKQ